MKFEAFFHIQDPKCQIVQLYMYICITLSSHSDNKLFKGFDSQPTCQNRFWNMLKQPFCHENSPKKGWTKEPTGPVAPAGQWMLFELRWLLVWQAEGRHPRWRPKPWAVHGFGARLWFEGTLSFQLPAAIDPMEKQKFPKQLQGQINQRSITCLNYFWYVWIMFDKFVYLPESLEAPWRDISHSGFRSLQFQTLLLVPLIYQGCSWDTNILIHLPNNHKSQRPTHKKTTNVARNIYKLYWATNQASLAGACSSNIKPKANNQNQSGASHGVPRPSCRHDDDVVEGRTVDEPPLRTMDIYGYSICSGNYRPLGHIAI